MKPKGKKHTRPPSFMRELDPHFDSRLPDNYFTVRDLPGKPYRFVGIEFSDDGVTSTVVLRFLEGARPRVDAYLNELSDFNAGEEIVPGHTLPENAKLIYASSDTAQFFGVNKCIKAADSFAAPSALRPAASSWLTARRLPATFIGPRGSGAGSRHPHRRPQRHEGLRFGRAGAK